MLINLQKRIVPVDVCMKLHQLRSLHSILLSAEFLPSIYKALRIMDYDTPPREIILTEKYFFPFSITLDKTLFFNPTEQIFYLFLYKNTYCG